ncbi:hypothetical protein BpHYR1_026984 [Brachionus plicatilis]|uniref:Uncharacterized protein n=1 Tax=Brachionus plicatilis TaxID=10195 RepID=A0A3M7SPB0_BRAPC|nr:hypothetical protein BpHYR1_026984 [Brachionus plicatilis]
MLHCSIKARSRSDKMSDCKSLRADLYNGMCRDMSRTESFLRMNCISFNKLIKYQVPLSQKNY